MPAFVYANNVSTTLANPLSAGGTTITLASSVNLPALAAGQTLALTLNDAATQTIFEIVYVTAISGANLTVTRAQEGTAAQTWLVGDYAFAAATAGVLANFLPTTAGSAVPPQGRLSLVTGVPYQATNVVDTSSVFYTPAVGNLVPIYNGSAMAVNTFLQQLLTLTAGANVSGKLYDVFAYYTGGNVLIGTGPAWTNATTRSAAITLAIGGIWTNASGIILNNGATTTGTISPNQATYLGTIYCDGSAQVSMNMQPSAAAGGSNNILGVYNAYNRARVMAQCLDSTGTWTPGSTSWEPYHAAAGNLNRITFVDGLQQSMIDARFNAYCALTWTSPTPLNAGEVGINLDSTTATPTVNAITTSPAVAATGASESLATQLVGLPQLGLHYVQAMELMIGTVTFNGANSSGLWLALDM